MNSSIINDLWKIWPRWRDLQLIEDPTPNGEELYKQQMDDLHDYLLFGKVRPPKICTLDVGGTLNFNPINKGEVIAGSFMTHVATGGGTPFADIDFYFHTKEDAAAFLAANIGIMSIKTQLENCAYGYLRGNKVNLIWGYAYKDAGDLIASFDIRACAIAYEINTGIAHWSEGAITDSRHRYIVWQPSCRHATVKRLVKYTKKGFGISGYQQATLAELIKAGIHSPEVELAQGVHTGYEP